MSIYLHITGIKDVSIYKQREGNQCLQEFPVLKKLT